MLTEIISDKFDASKNLTQLQGHATKDDIYSAWGSGGSFSSSGLVLTPIPGVSVNV